MSIPSPFVHLVDDAAIFPPGLAPLVEAVSAHREHLTSEHAELVGAFVVDTARLDALAALDVPKGQGLAVSVVVPTPGEVADCVERVARAGLVLAGLEVKLGGSQPPDVQVADVVQAAPEGVATYIEVPRPASPDWPVVLDAVAAHGLRAKFRTGGTEADAFPTEAEVAQWIEQTVSRGVAFKCTAGLHHAVRHTAPDTGFEHHGYLNVLLATVRATEGEGALPALAARDPQVLVTAIADCGEAELNAARGVFDSYGSCSIREPLEDLTALHLIPARATDSEETA